MMNYDSRPVPHLVCRPGYVLAFPFVLVTVTMLMFPALVMAEDDKTRASVLFKEGNRLRKERRFTEALEKYDEAYRIYPSYKIDLNRGLTLQDLGREPEAAMAYQRFLYQGAGKISEKKKALALRKLGELQKRLALLEVQAGPMAAPETMDKGDDPLQGRKRQSMVQGEVEISPRFRVGLSVGGGIAFLALEGETDHEHPITNPNFPEETAILGVVGGQAFSPLHIEPRFGYRLTQDWELGATLRIQIFNFTTQEDEISFHGEVRVSYLIGSGLLSGRVGASLGGGQIRHRINLGDYDVSSETNPTDLVDTRLNTCFSVSVHGGLRLGNETVGVVIEPVLRMLIPDIAVHLDLNIGPEVNF